MKTILMILLLTTGTISIFSNDPINVRAGVLKASDNFDTSIYGGRLEPANLISLYAPVSGYVSDIFVTEGDEVEKNTAVLSITRKSSGGVTYNPTLLTAVSRGKVVNISVSKGQEVFEKSEIATLADTSSFKVTLLVSDREINLIKPGSGCFIQNGKRIEGRIAKISLLPENRIGLFKVEASFAKDDDLFIGKFVTIEIRYNFTKGISIPQNLIYNRYGKTFIFIVENGKAVMREIKIINVFGPRAVIGGVKEGEKYITYSETTVNDGDTVKIENEQNRTGSPENRNGTRG